MVNARRVAEKLSSAGKFPGTLRDVLDVRNWPDGIFEKANEQEFEEQCRPLLAKLEKHKEFFGNLDYESLKKEFQKALMIINEYRNIREMKQKKHIMYQWKRTYESPLLEENNSL